MEIIRGLHNLRPRHRGCVATIGNFDGVHHGHHMVIAHLNAKRDELGAPSTLITFEPQPREFFLGRALPARLTRFREKMVLLQRAGLGRVLCLPFNERLAMVEAEAVIQDFLVHRLGVRYVVLGDDSRFGRDRRGDYAMLKVAGDEYGFGVSHIGTLTFDHERVSSTRIRVALREGDFATAEKLLGHRYVISGRVAYGRQLGRQLGTPTANIKLQRYQPPVEGVFAVEVEHQGVRWPSVANVGVRPTVDGKQPMLEAHLFDFSGDLYGQRIDVIFRHRIRPEQAFASLDELKAQIERDCLTAREWFRVANG